MTLRRRRWRRAGLLSAIALGAGGLGLILLASPAHRTYYLGWLGARTTVSEAARQGVTPGAPSDAGGGRPAPEPLTIPTADALPAELPAPGVPAGWQLREFAGQAAVATVPSDVGPVLRLRSDAASFALYRGVVVDLDERPVLAWSWKVAVLPAGADVRDRATDDQAVQIYVVFPRWPAPAASSDVIGYVWDTSAPAGTKLTSTKAANVRVVVVESGPRGVGAWRHYRRNVRDDYTALFGRRPPRVGGVAVMIDTEDTRGAAEALVGDLVFSAS